VKNILAKRELSKLGQFVDPDTLIAFDFDGTLAPLARDPRAAQLRKSTLRLLTRVAQRYPTVVISGRPRADVLARLNGAPVRAVIGNYGLEPSPDAARYHGLVKKWLPQLRDALASVHGLELENKLYSVSIHYRRARGRAAARAAIESAVQALGTEARIVDSKLVVNVLPSSAPKKGSTLLDLREAIHAKHAVFVGEDMTDEGAAATDQPQHLLGIRVGRAPDSGASHYLAKQADIDHLLKRLLELSPTNDNARG
jgi:trehalose 6-phosphate phosphatase